MFAPIVPPQDLDTMAINNINTAFEQVRVVDNAVRLLQFFRKLAHRSQIKLFLEKKLTHVFNLFMEIYSGIRQEFQQISQSASVANEQTVARRVGALGKGLLHDLGKRAGFGQECFGKYVGYGRRQCRQHL